MVLLLLALLFWSTCASAQTSQVPGLRLGPVDIRNPVNKQHALGQGLVDWWRVVRPSTGGQSWKSLITDTTGVLTNMTTVDTTGFSYSSLLPTAEGSVRFNGTNSYVLVNSGTYIGDLTAFTVVAGFRTTMTTKGVFYQERGPGGSGVQLSLHVNEDSTGDLACGMVDNGSTNIQTQEKPSTANDGAVHYAACVQTSKSARALYMDGTVRATSSSTIATLTLGQRAFGARPTGTTSFLNGALIEILIYNRALSALEVRMLYDSALQGHPSLLNRPSPLRGWQDLVVRHAAGSFWPFFQTPPQ